MGVDDIAFHRRLFELDRITPRSVAGILWELQRPTDGAARRVAGWTRSLVGFGRYARGSAARGREAARLALALGCPHTTIAAVTGTLESWDGAGAPYGRAGQQIPIAARIIAATQLATVWGEEAAPAEVAARLMRLAGVRLDPEVVRALLPLLEQGLPPAPGQWVDHLAEAWREPAAPPATARSVQTTTIAQVFAEIVDAKSPFTATHSQRVAAIAGAMVGVAGDDLRVPRSTLVLAGLLHDLGKLAVANAILDKPTALDAAEWVILRQHPADSARIAGAVPGWRHLAEWVGAHHERPDGRGYHRGLAGAAIPPVARLLAVADAFDAMTADRPYRAGLPVAEALRRLRAGTGTQFDPHGVDLLAAVVSLNEAALLGEPERVSA